MDLPRSSEDVGSGPPKTDDAILIIDDNLQMLEALEILLSDEYRIIACTSSAEVVALYEQNQDTIRAAIIDIRMPGHDGFWVAGKLRVRSPILPLIFHSAFQDVRNPYDVINEFQPFAYLRKGDDTSSIVDTVKRAVRYCEFAMDNRRTIESMTEVGAKLRRSSRPRKL